MPLVVQADQMSKELNAARLSDYTPQSLPLLLLQVKDKLCLLMKLVRLLSVSAECFCGVLYAKDMCCLYGILPVVPRSLHIAMQGVKD